MSIGAALGKALGAIEQWQPIAALRESTLAYPLVNALHIVGIALLFGAIVALDLRLIGWRRNAGGVDQFARLLLPVATGGLIVAILAGLLLFATDARDYAASPLFQAKMLVVGLAIANAVWLRLIGWREPGSSRRAAIGGAASILLWLAAIVLGRMIGYF